jgi:serine/threonine protein phosphatase PrpC
MQGWRICEHRQYSPPRTVLPRRSLRFGNRPYVAMEDAHATVLELDDREKNAFFAVYDGHGGELHREET